MGDGVCVFHGCWSICQKMGLLCHENADDSGLILKTYEPLVSQNDCKSQRAKYSECVKILSQSALSGSNSTDSATRCSQPVVQDMGTLP